MLFPENLSCFNSLLQLMECLPELFRNLGCASMRTNVLFYVRANLKSMYVLVSLLFFIRYYNKYNNFFYSFHLS